ncbi:MAG: hypothetical protein VKS61_04675 [Candidatus Sericytochromatia bacterium]|nr:hypothetical protein [Candidatus Sericytochromatia bacterium]MEB3221352.1 hypothetical protein [Candidatus Sericytochromatia bacterium]
MAERARWLRALLLASLMLVLVGATNLSPAAGQRPHPAAVTLLAEEEAAPVLRDTLALRVVARKRAADPLRPVRPTWLALTHTPLRPGWVPLAWRTPGARAPPCRA